ncbi:LysR family glycine cleavage system transcriptional activator [Variovorax boronicumulans]|uniref:LysR family glycine cleavage system transcriptional activator n=1 Tax=Variovorax boronicumulans TaxID=436515 RepID=A0AAW8DUB2_9BURK|nr:transcriptional regulator GcvA [Variovorax boronicumulans]MDP9877502.1 LysR family glycine cleavage system transcriptional activator [Variovorax boronicumulans]MDP9922787.1 LysR family glycine cleavage system transcriptional activator [Variovorax boronicumulans]
MKRARLPSITALTAFESAARHLNFRRAADELHLTQGAVSQQVRQLEENLGVALFARVRQRVLLTGPGARYLEEVRRILRDLGEVTNQAMATGDKEILNLASVPTFAVKWLIPRLPAFLAMHPEVNVNLVSRSAPFDFAKEPFDAAIHYGEPAWPGAVATPLMDEDMIPVSSRTYRQALKLRTPADLGRATLLQQFTRPSAWQDWFRHVQVEPPNAFRGPRFDSFNMILEAVLADMGAALLPRFLVASDIAQGRIVQLSRFGLPSSRGYHFVCPEARRDAPAVVACREWLLAAIAG